MPGEILLGGLIASALVWIMGSALGKVWADHKKLTKRVEDHSVRLTRLETLMKTLEGED
jgi:hypothetical protein